VRDHFIAAEISNPFHVVVEKRKLYATHELPIRKPKVNKNREEGLCPDDEHRFFGGNL
jgi:hypothetical protein